MDLDFVHKLIEMVSRSPIGELEIERDGVRIRISKEGRISQPATLAGPSSQSGQAVHLAVSAKAAPAVSATARHSIRASLTGVFYRSTAEGEPPLVSIGDVIEEGQKIAVLEAMKTFNVVESDRAGRIIQIAFEDHAAVQSGDVLFVLEEVG
ncbi:acetyl-CoA carboxylase biotin carboxyl carrier protein subunit [Mesorhizobium sp. B283B1A]|uniref:acetyl-CoA carboxylase biotin carboxyl carrier protein n=1 Tax=Mesorhizobium TaxID=68287 RepID=UPI001CD12393|nr:MULTISPECIES: biotin/lipoyl-containing protein [Mesorhizobium]MCA0050234.1 acetyl-CoA carboxylase biotin carboxyl carrier protein subunit [Mesorhizobium sp. B283B1A]UQS66565.1 acetyl-CoA carboxylase biotin carboxyl carrier protein subunit [Mesorhizobium opportunistum]